jgi:alpha-L-rhamnosidase
MGELISSLTRMIDSDYFVPILIVSCNQYCILRGNNSNDRRESRVKMIVKRWRRAAAAALCGALLCSCELAPPAAKTESAALSVVDLRVESLESPLGIGTLVPRLSWQILSDQRAVIQSAYEIRVARTERELAQNSLWDSGRIVSGQSIELDYAGPALSSRQRYFWQVRIWDAHGMVSPWSETSYWETGLLSAQDWQADWIAPAETSGPAEGVEPAPLLRRTFRLKAGVRSARAYVTSLGLYELHLNGHRVGEQQLTPGWTSFDKRLQYQTYDVTHMLIAGENAIGVILGDGWYIGPIGLRKSSASNAAGDAARRRALLLQLQITYLDGHEETITSDGAWKASTGPILSSGIYSGETYDARLERVGWLRPGYDDRGWSSVETIPGPKDNLVAPVSPPVTRHEELRPVRVFKTPDGDSVVDLGQNMVGWVRLKVRGRAGTTVTMRHAEILDGKGNLYTANLRKAGQEIRYTLKGGGMEVYEPHFTYQGFRYVAVAGYPGRLTRNSITGIVVHSNLALTGQFRTSNSVVNQLQHNILWGQKGNFVDVPTDCPQRDERLGWTGDAQLFSPTAAFNMDVDGFFTKWLADLAADQRQDGSVPWVVPDVLIGFGGQAAAGAAGWGDAATIIPWNLYLAYADTHVLQAQYESMRRWVEYERSRAGETYIWAGGFQFGDWLDYFSAAKHTNAGSTSPDLIATAYFAHSVDILERTAKLLGKSDDAARYAALFESIAKAFNDKFVTADAHVGEGTQTAYVLALDFDLLPEAMRKPAAELLAQDVREKGHLTTGFLGTPRLLAMLSRYGYLSEGYMLLNRTAFPSWLYQVEHGATTIWERWDGIKPDGTLQDESMNSFNHYAYGAVGAWMYEVMAGINVDANDPGYKHVIIKPQPGGGFSAVSASHESPYGRVATAWDLHAGIMQLRVEVPANTRATVELPGAKLAEVRESGRPLAQAQGITNAEEQEASVILEAGSGRYNFRYPLNPP